MAGNRCESCAKMVSLEFDAPEEQSFEAEVSMDPETGNLIGDITATVRIVRSCADCSSEMKEATLELSHDDDVVLSSELLTGTLFPESVAHIKLNFKTSKYEWLDGHGLEDTEHDDPEQIEEGGGRYAKSYFGASIAWRVNCKCGKCLADGTLEDKVAASAMDEI